MWKVNKGSRDRGDRQSGVFMIIGMSNGVCQMGKREGGVRNGTEQTGRQGPVLGGAAGLVRHAREELGVAWRLRDLLENFG